MTFEEFEQATSGFEVTPMYVDGKISGAVIVKENHIHACILPEYSGRWFSRKAAKILNRIIEKYGEATTSATTPDGEKFVLGLGFIKDGDIYRSKKKWESKR